MKSKLDYFYGNEAIQFSFYRIPSHLILSDEFSGVSYGAKILYGLLLSRMEMSITNKWFDNQGRAYIIYSIAEVQENMNCCKATAIKMMSELEKAGLLERKRPSKENCDQFGHNYDGRKSVEIMADNSSDSRNQIQRYIRLTNLIDPFLDLLDKGEMAMSAGVELSYLGSRHQAKVYKVVERDSTAPSIAQAAKLRKTAEAGELDDAMVEHILTVGKEEKVKLVIYEDKLRRYFPKSYSKEQIEDTVMKLIQKWHKNREKENER